MKVLVATEKPFSKVAVDQIREIVEKGGHELATSLQLSRNILMYSSFMQQWQTLMPSSSAPTR